MTKGGGKKTGGGGYDEARNPNAVHAPYNFVPLSPTVVLPAWGDLVSHDRPFKDGLSGHIDLDIKATTPLVVGGGASRRQKATQPGEWNQVRFFLDPEGRPAIPGSSLKGIIRNVVEIASFSRLSMVDDRRLGLRDLTTGAQPIYGTRMTSRVDPGQAGSYLANVHAGFLYFDTQGWRIVPARYARIEHTTLTGLDYRLAGGLTGVYASGHHRLLLDPDVTKPGLHGNNQFSLCYLKVTANQVWLPGKTKRTDLLPATLVITGPAPAKKMEFVFFCPDAYFGAGTPYSVPAPVIDAFLAIHKDQESDQGKAWGYWRPRLLGPQRDIGPGSALAGTFPGVPVFYLAADAEGTKVQALGLAQMFKLPYDLSIGETIAHTSPAHHLPAEGRHDWDMADLLFGTVSKVAGRSLKGRVSFGLAQLANKTVPPVTAQQPVVLNTPKPSYYPFYIRQDVAASDPRHGDRVAEKAWTNPATGQPSTQAYRSYTLAGRDKTKPDPLPEIAGWKRYLPAKEPVAEPKAGTDQYRVAVRLETLPAGARFTSRLRFHNLRPVELGALVQALCLGGSLDKLEGRHLVGGGKPYGFGGTAWTVTAVEIQPNDLGEQPCTGAAAKARLTEAAGRFADYMTGALNDGNQRPWESRPQIQALKRFATVEGAAVLRDGHDPYLFLDTKDGPRNRFQTAKGGKERPPRTLHTPFPVSPAKDKTGGPVSRAPKWLRPTKPG